MKSAVMATIVLLGFFTLADAQSIKPASPDSETPSSRLEGGSSTNAFTLGWNYSRVSYCTNNGAILRVILQQLPDFFTNVPLFITLVGPACQTGNWIAVFVSDANGTVTQVWTYSFN